MAFGSSNARLVSLVGIARVTILLICIQQLITFNAYCDIDDRKAKVNEYCKRRLNFKSIKRFDKFVRSLKEIEQAQVPMDKSLEYVAKCLAEKEAIYALHDLVLNYEKERPCKYSEVSKLEEFAKKYLLTNPRARTTKFFTLFGVSIGISCRINLLAHLKQADSEADQMDFIHAMASPTGWNTLINEYTKKSMKFGTSGHQDSHVINRVAKLVPGLSQIDQLDYLNFHHVMNDQESSQFASRESGSYQLKNVSLKPKVVDALRKIINSCKNLDKLYVNSVLSMAKLNGLGLMVDFLHDLHDRSALLHKWLVATSFCQLMVRVNIMTGKDDQDSDGMQIGYEIVHNDKLLKDRTTLYSYAAPFEEIHERAYELTYQAAVYEGRWRQKTEAMWLPSKERPAISVAMKLLKQYIKGVEHDFQQELDSE